MIIFSQRTFAPIAILLDNRTTHPTRCLTSSPLFQIASGGGGLNSGLMMIFSQRTFAPIAILLDNGLLTELRTAAAGALAACLFAPRQTR
jgi:hypothetical protein